jgi:hypothetical protein
LIAGNMTLRIATALAEDDGEYKCLLTSRNTTIERKFTLSVKSINKETISVREYKKF